MAPERNELLYDQMLKSMLAPKSYMEGLIAGSADKPEDSYIVPKGMSTDLCMLAVLGAILSDENTNNMRNSSSSQARNLKDWIKVWFIRDYAGSDEIRGVNMMNAISSGRQKAIKAFLDYENGSPGALNELISHGAGCIKEAVKQTSVGGLDNWLHTTAAVRLLNKAASFQTPMGIEKIKDEDPSLAGIFHIEKCRQEQERAREKFEALPKDAPKEEREALILEITTYGTIIDDFQKELDFDGYDFLVGLAKDAARAEFGNDAIDNSSLFERIGASAEYKDHVKNYFEIYTKTHPGKLVSALKNPENYDEIFRQYKEQVEQSDRFRKALGKNMPLTETTNIEVNLNIPGLEASEKETAELQKTWEDASAQFQKEIVDIGRRIPQAEELINAQLTEIANKYALHNYKVFRRNNITNERVNLADYLNTQRKIYLYDDQHKGIVEVHSDNGKDLIATPVREFVANPGSKNAYRDVAYANELRPVLKVHAEYVIQQEKSFLKMVRLSLQRKNIPTFAML